MSNVNHIYLNWMFTQYAIIANYAVLSGYAIEVIRNTHTPQPIQHNYIIIGYEPAGLTIHPPPPKKNDRGWVYFFRIGV